MREPRCAPSKPSCNIHDRGCCCRSGGRSGVPRGLRGGPQARGRPGLGHRWGKSEEELAGGQSLWGAPEGLPLPWCTPWAAFSPLLILHQEAAQRFGGKSSVSKKGSPGVLVMFNNSAEVSG